MITKGFDLEKWGYSFEKNKNYLKVLSVSSSRRKSGNLLILGFAAVITMSSFSSMSGSIALFLMMLGLLILFKLITFFFPSKHNSKLISFTIDRINQNLIIVKKGRVSKPNEEILGFSTFQQFTLEENQFFTDASPFSNGNKIYIKKLLLKTKGEKIPLFSFSHSEKNALDFVESLKFEFDQFIRGN